MGWEGKSVGRRLVPVTLGTLCTCRPTTTSHPIPWTWGPLHPVGMPGHRSVWSAHFHGCNQRRALYVRATPVASLPTSRVAFIAAHPQGESLGYSPSLPLSLTLSPCCTAYFIRRGRRRWIGSSFHGLPDGGRRRRPVGGKPERNGAQELGRPEVFPGGYRTGLCTAPMSSYQIRLTSTYMTDATFVKGTYPGGPWIRYWRPSNRGDGDSGSPPRVYICNNMAHTRRHCGMDAVQTTTTRTTIITRPPAMGRGGPAVHAFHIYMPTILYLLLFTYITRRLAPRLARFGVDPHNHLWYIRAGTHTHTYVFVPISSLSSLGHGV